MQNHKSYEQFENIVQTVHSASERSGRDKSSVKIIAVSKKQSVEAVQSYIDFCASKQIECELGENYVQEWKEKKPFLRGAYSCHAIGHLQSNKIKDALSIFQSIQTVDSKKIIDHIVKLKPSSTVPIWIQVNISSDDQKYGVSKNQVEDLISYSDSFPEIQVIGLMTITRSYELAEDARNDYRELTNLAKNLTASLHRKTPLYISMGMSDDFEVAIEEGATHVRIGSALFGARL